MRKMNKEIKCFSCVKFKTQYCPCTIDCMATETYPFYQDKRMILEENNKLKQALIDIREYINGAYEMSTYTKNVCLEKDNIDDVLQIIDKVLGDSDD